MATADGDRVAASRVQAPRGDAFGSAIAHLADPYAMVASLPRGTLGESAFEILRDSILSGRLFSGQHLVETSLARELGISRGPLREALALLQKDGLVEVLPRRGRFVLGFTLQAVDEFYNLRKVLETYAVELVIKSITEEKLGALEVSARQVEAAEVNRITAAIVAADLDFHGLLYALSGSQLLHRNWTETMASKLRLLVHLTVPVEYQHRSEASSHQSLVEAISARNLSRAQKLAVGHIEDARQRAHRAVARQSKLESS